MEALAVVLWGLGGGVVVTFLTSLAVKYTWRQKAKHLTATVLSVVTAVTTWLVAQGLDVNSLIDHLPHDLGALILAVYTAAQLFYNFVLKNTILNKVLLESVNKDTDV